MFHAPSQDSNLKTKGLTLAASFQSNVFNVLKFGSPAWIRTTIHGSKGHEIGSSVRRATFRM
jgi:hypothetical protein